MQNDIKLFEQKKIRSVYDEEKDVWYFSVIDVISILIEKDYQTARKYWNKLSERLRNEGAAESVTNCHQLKLEAADGKKYLTAVADAETDEILANIAEIAANVGKFLKSPILSTKRDILNLILSDSKLKKKSLFYNN